MKMAELILSIGDENVEFQNLDHCADTLNWSAAKGSRITFVSMQPLTPNGTEKLGLVLWLNRDAVKDALAARAKGVE